MDIGDDKRQAPPGHAAAHGRGGGAGRPGLGGRGDSRGERLAAALRTNLAKRKEQGRARARHGTAAAGVMQGADKAASTPALPPPLVEATPHDSAEIITEKSADQAD